MRASCASRELHPRLSDTAAAEDLPSFPITTVTGPPPAGGSTADVESQYWETKAEGLQDRTKCSTQEDSLEWETGGQSVRAFDRKATLGKPVTQT